MDQHLEIKNYFMMLVISKASVWIPEMKAADFEEIMRRKYEAREKSNNYVEEAEEDLRFVNILKIISQSKKHTQIKEN